MSVIDRLWEAAEPKVYMTKEEFVRNLEGWAIQSHELDGELAFVTLTKGPAFHFHSLGTRCQISMKMIREFLQAIIDEHGYATTKTPKDDIRQHRFNRLFGFKVVGEDEFDTHYRIETLRHG